MQKEICKKRLKIYRKKCIRNVYLAKYRSHTQPIFKKLSILNFTDKITLLRAVFMNQYRNKKLPESFNNKFTDITCTDQLQTRHNDYNYHNIPAVKKMLESFPMKSLLRTWNSLSIDVKATADSIHFQNTLKQELLSQYCSDYIWVIRTRTGKKLDKCHFFFKSQRLLRTEKSKNSYTFKSCYLILAHAVLKI